jgi:cellulose synthase/poly-beta-1,6-N-acetylglucosamine synthase-like glycosyltransferase
MLMFISVSLMVFACILAIPVTIFFMEVVAALALSPRRGAAPIGNGCRPRVAVLVPAHNESIGLLPTLMDIKAQTRAADRLIVVADNCVDDTSSIAASLGAEVVDRNDPDRKGKGYALACGLHYLDADPPGIVIIVDADCRLSDAAIDQLATTCAATHRPVQALDLMIASDDSPINSRVAEFAWRVKNWVRPLGLRALGLPCQLMGTGMALPWDLIRKVDLASGQIVEDLKLGLDLALAGSPPLFCPFAAVTSEFPSSVEGVESQRRRWEQGHIGIILTATPYLVLIGIKQARLGLLILALDVAVPPLSLLTLLVMAVSIITALATLLGASSAPMLMSVTSLVGFVAAVFLCWLRWGRDILPLGSVLTIVSYIIKKIPLYFQILSRKSALQWIRTDRKKV